MAIIRVESAEMSVRIWVWNSSRAAWSVNSSGLINQIIILAFEILSLARSIPNFSMGSSVWRIPAVSMNRNVVPWMSIVSSTVSRVVPGISLTIALSVCSNVLSRRDLPTFGRPTMATGMPLTMAWPESNVAASESTVDLISTARMRS